MGDKQSVVPADYDVVEAKPGVLLISKKSVKADTTEAAKQKGKNWKSLTTDEKLDLLARLAGIIDVSGKVK